MYTLHHIERAGKGSWSLSNNYGYKNHEHVTSIMLNYGCTVLALYIPVDHGKLNKLNCDCIMYTPLIMCAVMICRSVTSHHPSTTTLVCYHDWCAITPR